MGSQQSLEVEQAAQAGKKRAKSQAAPSDQKKPPSPSKPYVVYFRGMGPDPYKRQTEQQKIRPSGRSTSPQSQRVPFSKENELHFNLQRVTEFQEETPQNLNNNLDPNHRVVPEILIYQENEQHEKRNRISENSVEEAKHEKAVDIDTEDEIDSQEHKNNESDRDQVSFIGQTTQKQDIIQATTTAQQKNIKTIVQKTKKLDDFESEEELPKDDLNTGVNNNMNNIGENFIPLGVPKDTPSLLKEYKKNNPIKGLYVNDNKKESLTMEDTQNKKRNQDELDSIQEKMFNPKDAAISDIFGGQDSNDEDQESFEELENAINSHSKQAIPDLRKLNKSTPINPRLDTLGDSQSLIQQPSSRQNTTKMTSNDATPKTGKSSALKPDKNSMPKKLFFDSNKISPSKNATIEEKLKKIKSESKAQKDQLPDNILKKSNTSIKKAKKEKKMNSVLNEDLQIVDQKQKASSKSPIKMKQNQYGEELRLQEKKKMKKKLATDEKKLKKQVTSIIKSTNTTENILNKLKKQVSIKEENVSPKARGRSSGKQPKQRASSQVVQEKKPKLKNKIPQMFTPREKLNPKKQNTQVAQQKLDLQKMAEKKHTIPKLNLLETPKQIKKVAQTPKEKPALKKNLFDPKFMKRPEILNRVFNTPLTQRKPRLDDVDQAIKKSKARSDSRKSEEKQVLRSYFNEDELKDFGKSDPIVCQGELYRFKPGIENNFIHRWVQVSGRAFRYFRNKFQAMGLSRPIVSFPKRAIEDVSKIKVNKKAFMKRKHFKEGEKPLFDHMFEVYLREDYEDIYQFREQEIKQSSLNRSVMSSESQRCKSLNNSFSQFLQTKQRKEMKLRSYSFNSLSRDRSLCNFRDDSLEKTEYNLKVTMHTREYRDANIIKKKRRAQVRRKNSQEKPNVNRIVQGHLMAVRDFNVGEQKHKYLEDQTIVNKEFGVRREQNLKYISNNVSGWTNRAVDWYNSERRIIFAATDEANRENWIKFFKEQIEPINKL